MITYLYICTYSIIAELYTTQGIVRTYGISCSTNAVSISYLKHVIMYIMQTKHISKLNSKYSLTYYISKLSFHFTVLVALVTIFYLTYNMLIKHITQLIYKPTVYKETV